MQSPLAIEDFAKDGRIGRAEREAYLKARERQLIVLPPEPKPPTAFERFGARAVTGTVAFTEPGDGKRKLGSAYGSGTAMFNRMVARPGKEKIKRRKKTEAELQAAMRDDMRAIRKKASKRDEALMPDTSPAIISARRNAERVYRNAKPRKRRNPPRHRRAKQ